MLLRGADEAEVVQAVRQGKWEAAKRGRFHAKVRLPCGKPSPASGRTYAFKVVDAVFADEAAEIVVLTVKVYYHD